MITVLGDGAFGTAFAHLLAINGHDVGLWCHNESVATEITTQQTNTRFLPSLELSKRIHPTTDLQTALRGTYIFEAIPVQFMRSIIQQCVAYARKDHIWISLSKGIEQETLLMPTQIIQSLIADAQCAVISGPSYARDLAEQHPTLVSLASKSDVITHHIENLLNGSCLKTELTHDLVGVELCGALKNIVALGSGILAGAGYQENTRTYMLLAMLKEMRQLIQAAGGDQTTVDGPAGIGDAVLTCFGTQSRNFQFGLHVNKKMTHKQHNSIPEGVNTLRSIKKLAEQHRCTMPLCTTIYDVIFCKKSAHHVITTLCQ